MKGSAVSLAAVVGTPDERTGEKVIALVICDPVAAVAG